MIDPHREKVLILDFGSQYTQLIARRIRELHVYCEIHPYLMPLDQIRKFAPRGIVLSGGPRSVYETDAPLVGREVLELGVPVLGICYGLQLINHILGGKVSPAASREYGRKHFTITDHQDLFAGLAAEELVWMSHGDHVDELAPGLEIIGSSDTCAGRGDSWIGTGASMACSFIPEVRHTPDGNKILANFLFNICKLQPLWTMRSFVEATTQSLKKKVGADKVICALSGGVDSSVTAVLIAPRHRRQSYLHLCQ